METGRWLQENVIIIRSRKTGSLDLGILGGNGEQKSHQEILTFYRNQDQLHVDFVGKRESQDYSLVASLECGVVNGTFPLVIPLN